MFPPLLELTTVEHLGTISELIPNDTSDSGGNGFSATITDVGPILEDVHLGDSISINGSPPYSAYLISSSYSYYALFLPIVPDGLSSRWITARYSDFVISYTFIVEGG